MNLNLENIDNLFRDNLETMEITPSPSVKKAVKKRMYYRNIFKATYFKIASSVIVLSIIGTIIFFNFNNTNTNQNIAQNTNISTSGINNEQRAIDNENTVINNENIAIDNENIAINNENTVINNKNIVIDNENIAIDNENIAINNEKTVINNEKIAIDNENIVIDNENIAINNEETAINNEKTVIDNKNIAIDNEEINNNKIKEAVFLAPNSTKESDKQVINNTDNHIFDIENSKSKSSLGLTTQTNKISVQFIDKKTAVLLNQNLSAFMPKINIPDDTIGFTVSGEEIIATSKHWFVGFNISPNYSFVNYSINNQENSSLVDKLNSSSSNSLAFDLGAEFGYQFKNISLISGINFTQYNEQFNAEYQETLIQETNFWEYNNYTQTIYDTTNYLNIDSLIQGDTSFTQIIDSTQITITDSTLASRTDTNITKQNLKSINKYKYIEIPLTIEFTFNRVKKFSPFVRTGLITGLHIRTQGFTYSIENNEQLIENTDLPYVKANFWLLFGAGFRYNINDKFSVLVYPYYRYHLNSLITDETYYRQSLDNMGINFGIRYLF